MKYKFIPEYAQAIKPQNLDPWLMKLMRFSCHNRSVEISVKPRHFRPTLDFYLLLFFQLIIPIQSDPL